MPLSYKHLVLGTVGALCALAVAAHVRFLWVLPDPFVTNDSVSYLHPAFSFLYRHIWGMETGKPFGYPAFLLVMLAALRHFLPILCFQHGLWLIMAALAALLYFRQFRASLPEAGVVFSLTALLPRGLVYSNMILSEVLFTFATMATLTILLLAVKRDHKGLWILAGVLLVLPLSLRYVGRAWVIGVVFTLLLYSRNVRVRTGGMLLLGAFLLTQAPLSLYKSMHRGTATSGQLQGVDLFISAAPLVDFSTIEDPKLKAALSPFYATAADRAHLNQETWVYDAADGPIQTLLRAWPLRSDVDKALRDLSFKTIKDHPFKMFFKQLRRFGHFLFLSSRRPEGRLSKEQSTWASFAMLDSISRTYPEVWRLTLFKPQTVGDYEQRMLSHPVYPYEPGPFPFPLIWPFVWIVGILPALALLASLFLCRYKDQRLLLTVFWSSISAHILISNIAAPMLVRYAIPLEPFYVILTVAGVSRGFSHLRRPPPRP